MSDSPTNYRAIPSSEDEAGVGGEEPYSTTERIPAEARAKWTYFLLGCAILLPWSGDAFRPTTHLVVLMSTQLWLMGRRFSCPDWLVPPSTRPSAHTGPASTH
jgi:hypothetical protein